MKKQKFDRNKEKPIQKYRFLVQAVFAIICIWIGFEFYLFVNFLDAGGAAEFNQRPPGAEGFLPISAMMSVYYFILTGTIHEAHPAGLFIFLAIVGVSFVFGKSFCSWICPVGFLSEMVGDFGEKVEKKLFKRKLKMPKFLDYPLRSLKYLLLGFFIYAIFFAMSELALKMFLDSAYNKVSDVKMYLFFADISQTALIVIAVLFVLSVIIRNFWCRYLCPYGALLGLISILSPNKIKRNADSCIDCSLCTKACPSNIKVEKLKTVISDECSTCMSCVDACPVKDTLYLSTAVKKNKISKKLVAIGVASIYIIIIGFGIFSGNWQNNISKEEYLLHYKNINSLGHPTSTKQIDELNKASIKEYSNSKENLDSNEPIKETD